jgi:hypothetical protein
MEWINVNIAKPCGVEVLTGGPSGTNFARWDGSRWIDFVGNDITQQVTHFALIDPLPKE